MVAVAMANALQASQPTRYCSVANDQRAAKLNGTLDVRRAWALYQRRRSRHYQTTAAADRSAATHINTTRLNGTAFSARTAATAAFGFAIAITGWNVFADI